MIVMMMMMVARGEIIGGKHATQQLNISPTRIESVGRSK
jgi:hypothetical protein